MQPPTDEIAPLDGDGDCASVAAHHVMEHPTGLVCHGYPRSRNPEHEGLRFFHAWIETPAGFVIDRSNGLNVYMPRDVYYAIGDIDDNVVSRYTRHEAAVMMMRYRHYGPWDGTELPNDDDDDMI